MQKVSEKQAVPLYSQQFIDLCALEYHKEVVARMQVDPASIVEKACGNLIGSHSLFAVVSRLERFETHFRSQRHIHDNLTPIQELLARLT
jgi:hypothetical protein